MDGNRRPAEGKSSSHHRSTGGSKKSTRRSSRNSSNGASGAGGDRATGYTDTRRESNGGVAARPDFNTLAGVAQGKESGSTRSNNENGHAAATGAEGTRRGNGGSRVRGEGERAVGSSARQLHPAEHQNDVPAAAGSSVDRAILEKWRAEASAVVSDRQASTLNQPKTSQDTPAEVVEEDEGGEGYDDEGFEEYSDEFDGDGGGDEDNETMPSTTAAVVAVPVSKASARASESRVVSPALKIRQTDQVKLPDDKALQELRHSLREENDVARERRVPRPTMEASLTAEAKAASSAVRGAKGAKGSKTTPTEVNKRGDTLARGRFSVEVSADSEARSSRKRSSSNFKMADAKALGRALAKGDPRTEHVRVIRAASRLEIESVRLFDQPPVTPIDLYHRKLRWKPAVIRQVASQTNDDSRSVEAQTDEITCANKEVQFHLGHDDTALENLMRRLRSARRPPRGAEQKKADSSEGELRTVQDDEGGTTIFKNVYHYSAVVDGSPSSLFSSGEAPIQGGQNNGREHLTTEGNSTPASRLGRFLRQACVVMETLCEENTFAIGGMSTSGHATDATEGFNDNSDGRFSLFPEGDAGWEEIGARAMASSQLSEAPRFAATEGVASDLDSLIGAIDVVGVAFSRVKRSMLVTAHARKVATAHRPAGEGGGRRRTALEGCGIVCVWNAESATPHVVLVGTAEGCLLLWDLREPASSSRKEEAMEAGLKCDLHPATYTTAGGGGSGAGAGIVDPGYGHTTAIVSAVAIPTPKEEGDAIGMGGMLCLGEANSFQVASLDDGGTVSIWLVTETPVGEEGGSQTDLGLSPGGRVRLTLSKSLRPGTDVPGHHLTGTGNSNLRFVPHTIAPISDNVMVDSCGTTPAAVARSLAFSPEDPNRFLLGTSSDRVAHASRLGNPPPPRAYRAPRRWSTAVGGLSPDPSCGTNMAPGEGLMEQQGLTTGGVICVNFSPFFPTYFLAGCGDGSVRLYKDDTAVPLTVWEGFSAPAFAASGGDWPAGASSVQWSEHRPAVFFVLDTAGTLHAFDLLEDDAGPVVSEVCPTAHEQKRGIFRDGRGDRNGTAGLESEIREEKGGETRGRAPSGATERRLNNSGWGSSSEFSMPVLVLSSETLATGSRPKVAVSVRGKAFTRGLSRRMFRPPAPLPLETALGGKRDRKGGGEEGIDEENSGGERERMKEWLGQILWA